MSMMEYANYTCCILLTCGSTSRLSNVCQLADVLVTFIERIMPTNHTFHWWSFAPFQGDALFLKDSQIPDPNMAVCPLMQ